MLFSAAWQNYQVFLGFVPTWWLTVRMSDNCSYVTGHVCGRGHSVSLHAGFRLFDILGHNLVYFMKIILVLHRTTVPRNIICVSLFSMPQTISFSASQIFQLPFESQNVHVDKMESILSMFLARRIWKIKNKKNIECIVSCLRKPFVLSITSYFLLHFSSLCVCVCVCMNICTCCWVHMAVRGQVVEISSLLERNSKESNMVC